MKCHILHVAICRVVEIFKVVEIFRVVEVFRVVEMFRFPLRCSDERGGCCGCGRARRRLSWSDRGLRTS